MYLFIDTSTDAIIFALINNNKKVVSLKKIPSNKNMVKMTNIYMDTFLRDNKINLNSLKGLYFTIGPGSFTGIKVSYLIAKALSISNFEIDFYIINTVELINESKFPGVVKISEKNFYYYENQTSSIKKFFHSFTKNQKNKTEKIIFSKINPNLKNQRINFDGFYANNLEKKIDSFEKKTINEIELIYVNHI